MTGLTPAQAAGFQRPAAAADHQVERDFAADLGHLLVRGLIEFDDTDLDAAGVRPTAAGRAEVVARRAIGRGAETAARE